MPCFHKFYGHQNHLQGDNGLLPNWESDTLIVGTFNPENVWAPTNLAEYFYGRSRYFWKVLPEFACASKIDNENIQTQFEFLQSNRVALTDLLISINDADINNPDHINWITSYLDNKLNNFKDFTWNTNNIINYINRNKVKTVYFTRLSYSDPFGQQIAFIENYCNRNKIPSFKLHTPTGQGLGSGKPRKNKLINRWYNDNGANRFQFLSPNFDVNNFEFK